MEKIQQANNDKVLFFFSTILFFTFYYSLRPSMALIPLPVDGPRIFLLFLFLTLMLKGVNVFHILGHAAPKLLSFLVFLNFYSLIGFLFTSHAQSDYGFVSYALNFILYSYATSIMAALYFRKPQVFLQTTYKIVLVQSVFIISTYVFPDLRELVQMIIDVPINANIDYLNSIQSPGLTSSAGAQLSFLQSIGIISLILLRLSKSEKIEIRDYCGILLIIISCLATGGRTGFIISILSLVLYTTMNFRPQYIYKVFIFLFLTITLTLASSYILEAAVADYAQYVWQFGIFFDFITNTQESSVGALLDMELPYMYASDYIFGTHRELIGHDSGYIKTYYTLGLPMAILAYSAIFIYLVIPSFKEIFLKSNSKQQRKLHLFFLLITLIVFAFEVKEPFIWKGILFFFMTFRVYLNRHENDSSL